MSGAGKPGGSPRLKLSLVDRYLLRMMIGPIIGALAVTLVALLLERALRLLDLLSNSYDRFGFVMKMTGELAPHYFGLALPVAFFLALFVVVARLSDGSEIDALLGGGVSIPRVTMPFVALGLALTVVSLIVFGYMQPYSRYAYRALLHAATSAGWNGEVQANNFVADDKQLITADSADAGGRELQRVFIRRLTDDNREEVITARTAQLTASFDAKTVTLVLHDGQRMVENDDGSFNLLRFDAFQTQAPLAGTDALLRARGGDERELTLGELAKAARDGKSMIPRGALLSELYGRLARAFFLPFLPLLAFPLGLSAKRGNRAPGLVLAGLLLLAFQHALQLGQSLAAGGHAPAFLAVWLPFTLFSGFSVWLFVGSRNTPGVTPISPLLQAAGDAVGDLFRRLVPRKAAA